jgi:lipopolysaccharide transport system ATP-binding protein
VTAVEVQNLSKNYSLSNSQLDRLRHVFAPVSHRKKPFAADGLWALREVSFSVERGESFGIIGANGSGKSTLLQIIAGILRPTSGTVQVNGRLSALLELGSGFSAEFTGRDNVYLNGSLLGLERDEITARFSDIERFAEIGDFIEQPIKTYSTGMVLRLAFAVAAHVDPEILIVDEALAVGDISFRQRCMRKIHDLRSRGTTILFVSHETTDVKALCERCLWLQHGAIEQLGETDEVVARYLSATFQKEISHVRGNAVRDPAPLAAHEVVEGFETIPHERYRYGDGKAAITGAALVDASGQSIRTVEALERVVLRISFRVNVDLSSPIVGFLVRNTKGETIFGTNTAREYYPLAQMRTGETHTVDFHWTSPPLAPGVYRISPAVADGNLENYSTCDYIEDAVEMRFAAGIHDGVRGTGRGYFQLQCASVAVHREPSQSTSENP